MQSLPSIADFFGMLYTFYFLSFILRRPFMAVLEMVLLGLLDPSGGGTFWALLWERLCPVGED